MVMSLVMETEQRESRRFTETTETTERGAVYQQVWAGDQRREEGGASNYGGPRLVCEDSGQTQLETD